MSSKSVQTPIIIKGKAENRVIWLHNEYVRERCNISSNHNRKNICMGQLENTKVWKCEKIEGVWYFDASKIPNREPKYYRNLLPTEAELVQMARAGYIQDEGGVNGYLKTKIEKLVADRVNQEDINYYQYTQGFSRETSIQLAEAKAWLEFISETAEDKNYVSIGIESKMDLYKYCVEILSEKKIKGIKIGNVSALRNKLATFPRQADLSDRRLHLIHKGKGNDNANVVNKHMIVNEDTGEVYSISLHLTLMYSLHMNMGAGNKNYKKVLHIEYVQMLQDLGYNRALAYQTFCRYTNEWQFKALASMERDGKKVFNNKYLPYVSAESLKMKHSLWGGDGSSTKLYFNDGGRARSLMCYRIADIASRKILGYCLYRGGSNQKGESEEIVLSALKMAYESTGVFAAELITDNGGCAGTNEFRFKMEKLFGKFTTITVGNSQENPTETVIKAMNNFGRKYSNWGGSSFEATKDENKNNPDYFNLSELPSYEEAIQQAIAWIEAWNSEERMTGYSPSELFDTLQANPLAKSPLDQAYRYVFGNKTKKPIDLSYQRGFLNIDLNGVEHKFTIPNFSENMKVLSQRTGMKSTIDVHVAWDGNFADIYNLSDEYILTCERTNKTHKSYSEATEDSWNNHRDQLARKLEMVESAEALKSNISEALNYMNTAKSTNGAVKDDYNEQMEEVFNQRVAEDKISLPRAKKMRKDAVEDLI